LVPAPSISPAPDAFAAARDIACVEYGGVALRSALDDIARAVDSHDHVAALAAEQAVTVAAAVQLVIATSADDAILPHTALERVITGSAEQEILPPASEDRIVALAAIDLIGGGRAL
jgi:hypothetical protein